MRPSKIAKKSNSGEFIDFGPDPEFDEYGDVVEKFEELFEDFESRWQADWSLEYIHSLSKQHPAEDWQKIGMEFACIDLTNRWKMFSDQMDEQLDITHANEPAFPEIAGWSAYVAGLGLNPAAIPLLQKWEYRARIKFGDCPDPTSYSNIKDPDLQRFDYPILSCPNSKNQFTKRIDSLGTCS